MNYMKHLKANWKVAFHSFNDFLEHFTTSDSRSKKRRNAETDRN